MLLQAHSFIVFLHPNAAMQRQLIDLNPFHETECQTAVVQESISAPPPKLYPWTVSLVLGFWYSRGWLSVTMKNPKAISWFNFKSPPPCGFHLTSLQQTTNRPRLLILECTKQNKQQGLVLVFHKTFLSQVLLYESNLAVLCLSGCPFSLCCWWLCPYSQTSRADKAQSGQLPLGF